MDNQIARKAKSHKGRLLYEKHNAHVEEYIRNTLFIRGNKSSPILTKAMTFLVFLIVPVEESQFRLSHQEKRYQTV